MPAWTGRTVADRDDVQPAIAALLGRDRSGTSALANPVQTGDDVQLVPDRSRILPVLPELEPVLPWPGGLLRGATVAAVGSTSLLLTLLAGATSDGAYAAVVGMPAFGALAALTDYRIPGDRLALVPDPGPDWPAVAGALLDGVDMLVVHAPESADGVLRSLQARARDRGCVLVPTRAWPNSDLVLERTARRWTGLRQGRGRLKRQYASFTVTGRGRASKPKAWEVSFPPESLVGPEPQPWPAWTEPALPAQDSTPLYRRPAQGEENPLWANITRNDPPPGMGLR
jgi:hypothetical protein